MRPAAVSAMRCSATSQAAAAARLMESCARCAAIRRTVGVAVLESFCVL
jgi:hypothetical protein